MSSSFFSYSRTDQGFAIKLADDLRRNGIDIWFDQNDIPKGALWDIEIELALRKCDTLIVVISSNSVRSNNVLDEISFAIEEGKKIIPIKISNCDIPFRIRRLQYIEFTNNYLKGLEELIKTFKKEQIVPPSPPKWVINKKWLIVSGAILLSAFILFVLKVPRFTREKEISETDTIAVNTKIIDTSNPLIKEIPKESFVKPNDSLFVNNLVISERKEEPQVIPPKKLQNIHEEIIEPVKKINWKDKYSKIETLTDEFFKVEKLTLIEEGREKYSKYTYGIVNSNGKEILECKYQDIKYNSITFFVKNGDLWGIVDKYGGLITRLIYSQIYNPSEGFYRFQNYRSGVGFLRLDGTELTSGFGEGHDFKEGMAAVSNGNSGQWGYINNKGELVIGYYYDRAEDFSEGVGKVYYTPKYDIKQTARFIKKNGDFWWPK